VENNDRVLVLKGQNIPSARKKLLKYEAQLKERDVVIKEKSSKKDFRIELYGKDGSKKWEHDENFTTIEILKLIDTMPMSKSKSISKKRNRIKRIKPFPKGS
jgi:hypothetical protein